MSEFYQDEKELFRLKVIEEITDILDNNLPISAAAVTRGELESAAELVVKHLLEKQYDFGV